MVPNVAPVLRVHASPSRTMVGLGASQFATSVGGSTRGACFTPSPSDTCFPDGSVINTTVFARRHFGMFVSRWNQTQVHAEGGSTERSLSARCALGAW